MAASLIIPWGYPPCNWPPYDNGAPMPYLSNDFGKQQQLIIEFDNAWWKAQPKPVQKLRGLTGESLVQAAQFLAPVYPLDAQVIGLNGLVPQSPFWAYSLAVYYGWKWKPSAQTPVNESPGRPECQWGIPGITPPGKTPYEDVDPSNVYMPIVGLQDTLTTLLEAIGVTSIKA